MSIFEYCVVCKVECRCRCENGYILRIRRGEERTYSKTKGKLLIECIRINWIGVDMWCCCVINNTSIELNYCYFFLKVTITFDNWMVRLSDLFGFVRHSRRRLSIVQSIHFNFRFVFNLCIQTKWPNWCMLLCPLHVHCFRWYTCTNRSRYCACIMLLLLLVVWFTNKNGTFLLSEIQWKQFKEKSFVNEFFFWFQRCPL